MVGWLIVILLTVKEDAGAEEIPHAFINDTPNNRWRACNNLFGFIILNAKKVVNMKNIMFHHSEKSEV